MRVKVYEQSFSCADHNTLSRKVDAAIELGLEVNVLHVMRDGNPIVRVVVLAPEVVQP